MSYLRVRNLERYQHYRKRNPPWIKWHAQVLSDYEFTRLHDASKWLAVGLVLLASQTDNVIPNDFKWIRDRLSMNSAPKLDELLAIGFIECVQDASNALATCISQTEGEGETETEPPLPPVGDGRKSGPAGSVTAVFEFWKAELKHPKALLNTKRRRTIEARLKEHYTPEQIMWAIAGLARSPHHLGENDQQIVYDDLIYACRDGSALERLARSIPPGERHDVQESIARYLPRSSRRRGQNRNGENGNIAPREDDPAPDRSPDPNPTDDPPDEPRPTNRPLPLLP